VRDHLKVKTNHTKPRSVTKNGWDLSTSGKSLGVDFTNILLAAYTRQDYKSTKHIVKPSVFFVLLGSALVKIAPKMLVKSTAGDNKQ